MVDWRPSPGAPMSTMTPIKKFSTAITSAQKASSTTGKTVSLGELSKALKALGSADGVKPSAKAKAAERVLNNFEKGKVKLGNGAEDALREFIKDHQSSRTG